MLESLQLQPPNPIELTADEMRLRDDFVAEYFVDYDYFLAAIRIGYSNDVANEFATILSQDSYVQQQIAKRFANPTEEDEQITKAKIKQWLMREANHHGPGNSHGARVSALSKLSSVLGMDAPIKTQVDHKGKVNIAHQIDYGVLDDSERMLVRQLLEKRSEDAAS